MSKILIIIPAFNEEATIGSVIPSVKKEMPDADIVVVNDGSHDKTSQIAKTLGAVVIDLPYNLGIGAAMQAGYRFAKSMGYDIAVQVDADGQHPANQIKNLIKPIEDNKADVIIGSRFLGKGEYKPSLARLVGMTVFAKVVSFIIKNKVTDTTSGFRAVNKKVVNFFSSIYPDDYPEVEALVLLYKAGFSIMDTAVIMDERHGGKSSITPIRGLYYMVKVLLAVFVDTLKRIEREA
ncbi:MAG: glycosyltransferase family 2 protein [Deltaproteobacteria bacterium]|nr:glycosyltransferase family 2 protein [Deltaproteobacteria bacterium]